jgi:hypothetical protein
MLTGYGATTWWKSTLTVGSAVQCHVLQVLFFILMGNPTRASFLLFFATCSADDENLQGLFLRSEAPTP